MNVCSGINQRNLSGAGNGGYDSVNTRKRVAELVLAIIINFYNLPSLGYKAGGLLATDQLGAHLA